MDYKELRTIKQLAKEAPFVSEAKIRWYVFHRETNGFKPAVIKVGGRIFIDRLEFNRWLESHRLAPVT